MAQQIGAIIPAALNLAPASSALTRSNPINQRLELALKAPKIGDATEEDLKNCLRYVFALVGIRGQNLPVDEEKEFLHQYIRAHYGEHSADEIRMAFDLAVQGKLDVDARTFENFSVAYFASIMNAFRHWAGRQELDMRTRNIPERIYTPEELKKINEDYVNARIFDAFNHLKTVNKLPCQIRLKDR